jgi:molybdate transport system substrate-binding protein
MRTIAAATLLALVTSQAPSGSAALVVVSVGAVEPGLRAIAAQFESERGVSVQLSFFPAAEVRSRHEAGQYWDVVIAPSPFVEALEREGALSDRRSLGRVGLGVAMRRGQSAPALGTVDELKQALLGADGVAISRGASGTYVEGLLKQLNLLDAVAGKLTRYDTGHAVFEAVLSSELRTIGFGQPTEMYLYRERGLAFVGPLPSAIQSYTAYEAASRRQGLPTAGEFLRYLGSPQAATAFAAVGVER